MSAQESKGQEIETFHQKVEQVLLAFDEKLTACMQNLDQIVLNTLQNTNQQKSQNRQNQSPLKSTKSNKNMLANSQSKSPIKSPNKSSRIGKTPENKASSSRKASEKKKKNKIPAQNKFLLTTPELGSEKFVYANKQLDNFVQYLQLNFLREDYLNENLDFLVQWYPNIFVMSENEKITQKERILLIQEQKAHLLKILWENWMIEWIEINASFTINVKVHEIEENYNGFIELLDRSLQIHGIVAWLIKQKLSRPKSEYHTWLILAQGQQQKNQNPFSNKFEKMEDKVYRLYHIKSAQKKDYKEQHFFEESNDLKQTQSSTMARILKENLHGDFTVQDDSKVLVKGLNDPNFQTFLLAERIQVR